MTNKTDDKHKNDSKCKKKDCLECKVVNEEKSDECSCSAGCCKTDPQ